MMNIISMIEGDTATVTRIQDQEPVMIFNPAEGGIPDLGSCVSERIAVVVGILDQVIFEVVDFLQIRNRTVGFA